jgi:hypothetical protein
MTLSPLKVLAPRPLAVLQAGCVYIKLVSPPLFGL